MLVLIKYLKMWAALAEVMREFYELGIPEGVKVRDVAYLEKAYSAMRSISS